jgi:transposase
MSVPTRRAVRRPDHIGPMSHSSILSPADLAPPSARRVPRPSRGDGWNTLADVEVFIFAVEAELEAMDRERVGVHRRGCKPDLALRRRLIGLIWMLTFGGMQWRIAGLLSGVPFTTLHSSFARWSRLGLWRRLGQRLALDWRLACGDEVLPSAVVVDSRSLRSSPSAWARGFDGGKLVKGIKLLVASDKHGSVLDLELHPANTDDRAGVLPTLPRLAALGFEGDLLGDSGFKGAPFAAAALAHGIHVSVSPGGTRDGRFLPRGIRWVVERLFAWLSRYRRLNIVYDRAPDLLAAHIWIAMISILSRRLVAKTQPQ